MLNCLSGIFFFASGDLVAACGGPGCGGAQGAVVCGGSASAQRRPEGDGSARAGAAVRGVVDPMARECCTNLKQSQTVEVEEVKIYRKMSDYYQLLANYKNILFYGG